MLQDRLRAEINISLADFKLVGGKVWRNHRWTKTEVEFLNFCLNQKHLSLQEFYEAVEKRIIDIGYEMYKQATPSASIRRSRAPEYADHVTSPEALAFAISRNRFTPAQLGAIDFDHGDTPATFMQGRTITLMEDVMKQLMDHGVEQELMSDTVEVCHHTTDHTQIHTPRNLIAGCIF